MLRFTIKAWYGKNVVACVKCATIDLVSNFLSGDTETKLTYPWTLETEDDKYNAENLENGKITFEVYDELLMKHIGKYASNEKDLGYELPTTVNKLIEAMSCRHPIAEKDLADLAKQYEIPVEKVRAWKNGEVIPDDWEVDLLAKAIYTNKFDRNIEYTVLVDNPYIIDNVLGITSRLTDAIRKAENFVELELRNYPNKTRWLKENPVEIRIYNKNQLSDTDDYYEYNEFDTFEF